MTTRFGSLKFASFLFVGTTLIQGCASADPGISEPEAVETVEQAAGNPYLCQVFCKPTTACSTKCSGAGTCGAYGQCADADADGDGVPNARDNCVSVSNANQANCDGDALGDACETDRGRYVYKAPTNAICHIDTDKHIDGVDVELYTADEYQDTSCLHLPDGYRKRQVSSVHCGFHSEGTCKERVTQRLIELSAQGYYPAVTDSDRDACPNPRIPDGAIAAPTPTPNPDPPRSPGPIP